jgi:hypothetical protein
VGNCLFNRILYRIYPQGYIQLKLMLTKQVLYQNFKEGL